MKILIAGGTGAIGRPLLAELLARGHDVVALTRSAEKAQSLIEQGVEPVIADVFDADALRAALRRARPEVVIEQLTALPKTYTRDSMRAAAPLNQRLRLQGGANVLAAARAAGVRRYPPTIDFGEIPQAVRYRITVAAARNGGPTGGPWSFEADKPWTPLTPVWIDIPPGNLIVSAVGLDADGKEVGMARPAETSS